MRYLMFVCPDDSIDTSTVDVEAFQRDVEAWVEEMTARGVRLQGQRLVPTQQAVTVRVRNGEVLRADGPFAETKEHIAGFDILDCATLDEAVDVASRHPLVHYGAMELRPYLEP
jgi:hypothetical protein